MRSSRIPLLLAVLLLVAGAGACAPAAAPESTPTPTAPAVAASLGQEFRLRLGQRAEVEGLGPLIFVGVAEDSRCPSDVTCVWEGRAIVGLEVAALGHAFQMASTGNQGAGVVERVGDYEVSLLAVEPYPLSTRTLQPEDYGVTLIVTPFTPAPSPSLPQPPPTAGPPVVSKDLLIREVPISSLQVLVLESLPYRLQAQVAGYFSDGCTTLHAVVQARQGSTVQIGITSERPRDAYCIQVIVPYEATIPLEGTFPPGDYTVTVNGVSKTVRLP